MPIDGRATTLLAFLAALLASAPLSAQPADPAPSATGWRYAFAPYLRASAMEGEASFKGLPPQPVELSFGDVWSNLDFGVLGAFEAHNGRWASARTSSS
jgi:hypothetical protein